jgi:hypothetical protein
MSKATSITVRVPLAIRRRPGRKTLVTSLSDHGGPPASTGRADPALVKALARAHRWQRLLEEGRYASLGELAAGERIDRGYLGRVLRLTLFAPPHHRSGPRRPRDARARPGAADGPVSRRLGRAAGTFQRLLPPTIRKTRSVKRITFAMNKRGFIRRICADEAIEAYIVDPKTPRDRVDQWSSPGGSGASMSMMRSRAGRFAITTACRPPLSGLASCRAD